MRVKIFLLLILSRFVFAQTSSPHGKINFPCSDCHLTDSWKIEMKKMKFDHGKTGFDLLGKHQQASCESCHKKLIFSNTPSQCISCHADFHKSTLGFQCQRCHEFNTWKITNFRQRHNETRFALTFAHKNIDCSSCHKSLVEFSGLPLDCYGCHKKDYENVSFPNHVLARFSPNCTDCHKAESLKWSEVKFVHPEQPLKLDGKHAQLDCFYCHKGVFYGTPSDCFTCHQNNFVSAVKPNHTEAGFSHECQICHTTLAWKPSKFDHNTTNFKLTGKHLILDCSFCHKGVFSGTPTDCYSCHQSNYASATNPDHRQLGFPTNCEQCHTTDGWRPATFDHNRTGFALTGRHSVVQCSSCHKSGYSGTPTDCYSCHQSNYASATNPDHRQLGFPTNCEQCHTTDGWRPATFDHNRTGFALTGRHSVVQCSSCHKSGYSGTPTDCYSCHQSNYTNALIPVHTVGYPYNCEMCHTTNGWKPSSFNHDAQYFRIYSGKHSYSKGRWRLCVDCHLSAPNSFQSYSCTTNCHNNRTKLDTEHRNVPGYNYDNQACYSCHKSV